MRRRLPFPPTPAAGRTGRADRVLHKALWRDGITHVLEGEGRGVAQLLAALRQHGVRRLAAAAAAQGTARRQQPGCTSRRRMFGPHCPLRLAVGTPRPNAGRLWW